MARPKKKNQANATGRSEMVKAGSFSRLSHEVQNSPSYRSLTPNARSLLMELISLHKKENNGFLYLSEDDAAHRMGVANRKTARAAFSELCDAGMIYCTGKAFFSVKTGEQRARRWALSWDFDYANRKPAAHSWRDFEPSNQKTQKRVANGMKALKRYRRERVCDDNANSVHAGIFYPFDPQNASNGLPTPRVRNGLSTSCTAENGDSCAKDERVDFTHYTAVTRGKGQVAAWVEGTAPYNVPAKRAA